MTARGRAARATLIGSGASAVISIAHAFVLMPLCLRYLRPGFYGAWLAAFEVLLWLQVLDLGLPNLLAQRVGAALGARDTDRAGAWFGTCLAALLAFVPLLAAAGLAAAELLPAWTDVAGAEARVLQGCFRVGMICSLTLLLCNSVVGLSWGVQRTALVSASVVAGSAASVCVSVVLLVRGWGLWALPAGMVFRAAIVLAGCVLFLLRLRVGGRRLRWRPDRQVARELTTLVPATGAGTLAHLLSHHTEVVLVTTFFGTIPATVYVFTRKAAETLRGLLDTIGYAVYGGVANLVSSEDSARSRPVVWEIERLRLALSCVAAGCYAALNRGFVSQLFGPENYGGTPLTITFALVLVVVGQAFLVNFLYRAAGALRLGSMLLVAQAALVALAMAAGLPAFGLIGAPSAALVVGCVSLVLTRRLLLRQLPAAPRDTPARTASTWVGLLVLVIGVAISLLAPPMTWPELAAVGAALLAGGTLAVLAVDPDLRRRLVVLTLAPQAG